MYLQCEDKLGNQLICESRLLKIHELSEFPTEKSENWKNNQENSQEEKFSAWDIETSGLGIALQNIGAKKRRRSGS